MFTLGKDKDLGSSCDRKENTQHNESRKCLYPAGHVTLLAQAGKLERKRQYESCIKELCDRKADTDIFILQEERYDSDCCDQKTDTDLRLFRKESGHLHDAFSHRDNHCGCKYHEKSEKDESGCKDNSVFHYFIPHFYRCVFGLFIFLQIVLDFIHFTAEIQYVQDLCSVFLERVLGTSPRTWKVDIDNSFDF